jgi:hypothetical protein
MLDVKSNFSTLYERNLVCRTRKEEDSVEDEDHLLDSQNLKSKREDDEVRLENKNDFSPISNGPVAPDYSVWQLQLYLCSLIIICSV